MEDQMIKQKLKTFCNAVEFDAFGKLYNLTPETGLSKLQKQRLSASVWDRLPYRLTWRGMGQEECIILSHLALSA